MKKKILIGSLLVLTLLLLMPSIPAVQQKSVEGGYKQEIQEKFETINLGKLKDIKVLDNMKHPILYEFVYLIYAHRERRLSRVLDIAVIAGFGYFEVRRPLLFLWAGWLGITSTIWFILWSNLSYNLGWGWFEDY